ncbi:MAG: GNAT family N-acetyltransferase [Candidatus Rokubacteria bacterium]|nr:GNAT family N-acetyltransferase [Candidatus Rokubacteria bacterium]
MIEAQRVSLDAPAAGLGAADQGIVVTRGKRVALRTFTPGDLVYLSEWAEDPFVERMVGSELLYAYKYVYDKHPSFYEACLTDPTQIILVITAREWSKPVGLVRLYNIHLLEGYAFLETIIANQRALRKGYGVQASKLVGYYAIDVLGLRRIEAKVYEYNFVSINSMRRNGFRQEGVLRKAGFQGGQCWDVIVFGILREEIEEQRGKDKYLLPLDGSKGDGSDTS